MLFIIILMNSSVKAYSKLKWTPEVLALSKLGRVTASGS